MAGANNVLDEKKKKTLPPRFWLNAIISVHSSTKNNIKPKLKLIFSGNAN